MKIYEVINENNWCQHHIAEYTREGTPIRWCTLGWLGKGYGESRIEELVDILADVLGLKWYEVPQWNDAMFRNVKEVKAAFKAANL
jgi:hypothetical protein